MSQILLLWNICFSNAPVVCFIIPTPASNQTPVYSLPDKPGGWVSSGLQSRSGAFHGHTFPASSQTMALVTWIYWYSHCMGEHEFYVFGFGVFWWENSVLLEIVFDFVIESKLWIMETDLLLALF